MIRFSCAGAVGDQRHDGQQPALRGADSVRAAAGRAADPVRAEHNSGLLVSRSLNLDPLTQDRVVFLRTATRATWCA